MKDAKASSYSAISGHVWLRGDFIDSGGMSSIYAATCDAVPGDYVIKIGNLLTEMRVYTKLCQRETLDQYSVQCMPEYIDGGVNKETEEQFLIMRKYKPSYPVTETIPDFAFINIVRDTLCALNYIHTNGYVHNDVKPDNILFNDQCFLLCDFGVAMKWKKEGYKDYTPKRFCGTKIFTGLDMHLEGKGPSPRSDIDSLIFAMLRWCGLSLPWGKLKDLPTIHTLKLAFLRNPKKLLSKCSSEIKQNIVYSFIQLNDSVLFDELPDYKKLNLVLEDNLQLLQPPCCAVCEQLAHIKNKLLLSNEPLAHATIKALKYVELW